MGEELELYDDDLDEEVEPERTAEMVSEEIAEASTTLARLAQEAAQLAAEQRVEETSGALVPTSGTAKAAKARLATLRAGAERQAQAVERKASEIREQQREIERLMKEQMALAQEALAPLEKFVKRLEEGIWTVNLYLGRDEEILALRDGEPAPAEEPVAIRQLVLAMDEECAINPDEGGIDSTDIEAFDAWLQDDPAHVDQVLPDLKGVVALRPRFRSKDYGDPWKNRAVAESDRKTYFLIRNGDRLWRTWTDFNVGDRLVPTADEFANYFYEETDDYRGPRGRRRKFKTRITPGTLAWEEAEERAGAQQRHYMRVALILQGLIDRTTVFHPLPEGGIQITDHEQGGRTWRFVSDAENLLTTGRQPFYEWLRERNAQLQIGMRIVGSFTRRYDIDRDDWARRIWPKGADGPPSGELLTIEDRSGMGNGFIVRYKRADKVWRRQWVETRPGWGYHGHVEVEPKQRASYAIDPDDRNVLPFDLVTEEEMLAYLNARGDRHAYSEMFPLLKQAIRAKRAEAEEERPFREMLAGVLARDNGGSVEEAAAMVPELVDWWKLTNKQHRPLVGSEADQAKAVRMISAEHARRVKAARRGVSDEIVERLREANPGALLIGRRHSGRYVMVHPHGDGPFVSISEFSPATGALVECREWRLLRKKTLASIVVAWESERLATWDLNVLPSEHLTDPEFERLAAEVIRDAKKPKLVAACYDPERRRFYTWTFRSDAVVDLDRPFSGPFKGVDVTESERRWERKGNTVSLRRTSHSDRPRYTYQRKPWDTRPKPGESAGWWHDRQVTDDEMQDNRYVVIYHNPELDERVERGKLLVEEARGVRRLADARAVAVADTIEAAWVERREREEYDRFIEDYADPELWEGHRKTLPKGTFDYPHHHAVGFRWGEEDGFALLVEHAVETGVDLDGLSVREAAERFFPDEKWQRAARGDGHFFRLVKADAIPEDILDLRFRTPEPDEEEDDADE